MNETTYPVELTAPDISPYRRGNTGVDYVTTFRARRRGPHVMIGAVVHGNELCGAIALDFLLRHDIRPRCGRLTLAFMNTAAYARFDPARPTASRYVDQDFNRVWSRDVLDGAGHSVELSRAREIRPLLDDVDYLLDIHSMQQPNVPLAMCGPRAKGRALAHAIGFPRHVVSDAGHAAGRRMRDYADFVVASSPKNALLVECGQHWMKSSAAVAKQMALRFLVHFDLIDREVADAYGASAAHTPQVVIEVTEPVTVTHDAFAFTREFRGMETIREAGTTIAHDGETPVRTPYDDCILIMPSRRLRRGGTAVRFGRRVG